MIDQLQSLRRPCFTTEGVSDGRREGAAVVGGGVGMEMLKWELRL